MASDPKFSCYISIDTELDPSGRAIYANEDAYSLGEGDKLVPSKNMTWRDYIENGVGFKYADFEFGIQDMLQAQYQPLNPMHHPESPLVYQSTRPNNFDFLIKFFPESEEEMVENHNKVVFLKSLARPWVTSYGMVVPPPKIRLNNSNYSYSTGIIMNLTSTHFLPVQLRKKVNDEYVTVIKYSEVVVSYATQVTKAAHLPYGNRVGFNQDIGVDFGGFD